MQLPPVKKEININTLISVGGFVIVIAGLVWNASTLAGDVDRMQSWITQHEQLHKERQAQVTADIARIDQRFVALENSVRKIDNLEYRVTVQEQGAQTLGRSVEELKTSLASQGADLRVIREIVTRLDPRTAPGN